MSSSSSSPALTTSFEAPCLKYSPDSKYRLKREATLSDRDFCDGTTASKAKYAIKRARTSGPGPNEEMLAAALAAITQQRKQEVAALQTDHHSSLLAIGQANQQATDQLVQQQAAEMSGLKAECEQCVADVKRTAQLQFEALQADKLRAEKELADFKAALVLERQQAEEKHASLLAAKEQEVMAEAEKRHASALEEKERALERGFGVRMKREKQAWAKAAERERKNLVKMVSQDGIMNSALKAENATLLAEKNALRECLEEADQTVRDLEFDISYTKEQLEEAEQIIKKNRELEQNTLAARFAERKADRSLKETKVAFAETAKENAMMKENIKHGIYSMSDMVSDTTLADKRQRVMMPSEKRNGAQMAAARKGTGAAPKGVQKAKVSGRKPHRKAPVQDDTVISDSDMLPDSANDNLSEAPVKHRPAEIKGLQAAFGIIPTPPASAEKSGSKTISVGDLSASLSSQR
ncbi:hypothetical protein PRZ48_012562 [Zasmidium cellare]|uniref:Uncharacterized protein n=1 Tax=Zasmidium cellare TaxID=395010 RepID=A0ABR0E591_ZASCE|nr:hypothetical protein PRZ48_012562 [Zasmidium cellare]